MKKIGIITHYFDSNNYGGMLQSYALVKCLQNLGYEAEQICFSTKTNNLTRIKTIKGFLKSLSVKIIGKGLNLRKKSFKDFEEKIPHSDVVYSKDTINESVNKYDIFITGSDQVWSFRWFVPSYFLDFVPSSKIKIAYAASLGTSYLNENVALKLKEYIKDFNAISLREQDVVKSVQDLTNIPVYNTLDPTLLLNAKDWEKISDSVLIKDKYIFCYFLGRDKNIRKFAKKISKNKKLIIVTLPNLQHHCEINDFKFGNQRLYDVNPAEFISLIRNADYIITDSFHATVFSCIFQKKFITFGRTGAKNMNNRIETILNYFGCSERFFPDVETLSITDINNIIDKDTHFYTDIIEKKKKESFDFLNLSLKEYYGK